MKTFKQFLKVIDYIQALPGDIFAGTNTPIHIPKGKALAIKSRSSSTGHGGGSGGHGGGSGGHGGGSGGHGGGSGGAGGGSGSGGSGGGSGGSGGGNGD